MSLHIDLGLVAFDELKMDLNKEKCKRLRYEERVHRNTNPVAQKLLQLMANKETNLCASLDLTEKDDILRIAEQIAPFICMLKTHVDIITGFDQDFCDKLKELAHRHDFLIFEDRKFADIGNTVKLQYQSGIFQIASWAHIVNCHTLPGEGIVDGLEDVGTPLGRGCLLLAQMSSGGNLFTRDYTEKTIEIAKRHSKFVFGFVAQERICDESFDFITVTPGVSLEKAGDELGQQYDSPHNVIANRGSDVIIVGRGIYEAADPKAEAKRYCKAGWNAYLRSLGEKISESDLPADPDTVPGALPYKDAPSVARAAAESRIGAEPGAVTREESPESFSNVASPPGGPIPR